MNENARVARMVGLTPMLARLAWHYVKKGVGTHYVEHLEYDNVVVSELYSWTVVDDEGQGCLRVRFRKGNKTISTVEMGGSIVGASGRPLVKMV